MLKKYYQELGENYCIGLFGATEEIKLQDNSYYNNGLYDEQLIWMIEGTEDKNFAYFFCNKEKFEKYLYNSSINEILNNLNQELDEKDAPSPLQDKLARELAINKKKEYTSEQFYARLTKPFEYQYDYSDSEKNKTKIEESEKFEEVVDLAAEND